MFAAAHVRYNKRAAVQSSNPKKGKVSVGKEEQSIFKFKQTSKTQQRQGSLGSLNVKCLMERPTTSLGRFLWELSIETRFKAHPVRQAMVQCRITFYKYPTTVVLL